MSAPTVIADDGNLCGEGPIWNAENMQLYWTDCGGLKFYRYDWQTRSRYLVREGLEINGCTLDDSGGFVITNNSGIWLWDGGDGLQLIAAQVDGFKCQMNDCIADPKGRLIAGSNFYDPVKEYEPGKLICVETDGTARIIDEGFQLSNGLGFSPCEGTLYFTDSAARAIFAYDYDSETGVVHNRRTFVRVPNTSGVPDGLTLDAEGFVWSAEWYGSRIVRYDPDGKIERQIELPAKQTSSLAFGGPELTDIFITSAAKSEPMPIMPPGYDPTSGFFGGPLYHLNLGIPGKAEFKTRIGLPRNYTNGPKL